MKLPFGIVSLVGGVLALSSVAPTAHGQCYSFASSFAAQDPGIQSLNSEHFIVGPAFEAVLSEYLVALTDYLDDPESFTFEDATPALASLAGFLVICAANGGEHGNCGSYMRKLDRYMPVLIGRFAVGAELNGC